MNDIPNIFNNLSSIIDEYGANPFGVETDPVNQAEYINQLSSLGDSADDYTNKSLEEYFNDKINAFLEDNKDSDTDKKSLAKQLSEEIDKKLKENGIELGTKEWLQNYNAIISSIGNKDPELRNALRANTVEKLIESEATSTLTTPRDISQSANTAWGEAAELIYEHAGDEIRTNSEELEEALTDLGESTENGRIASDNDSIEWIKNKFGSIEQFNSLLKDNGINQEIIKNDDDSYSIKENTNYNVAEVDDSEEIQNEGYRQNLNDWNETAGKLNNENLDDFDVSEAQELIDKYARINSFDSNEEISLEEGQELLEMLSKANLYNIKNGGDEFNPSKLNLARHKIMQLVHDAEDRAIEEDPDYERSDELNEAIKGINTLHQLKNKDSQENIISGLNQAAEALGHSDYVEATSDENNESEIEELINTINNQPNKSEFDLVENTLEHEEIDEINSQNDKILFKFQNGKEYEITKKEFLDALNNDYLILYGDDHDSNDDDIKIEDLREIFKDWHWDSEDNRLASSSETDSGTNIDLILNLPDDEQARILEMLGYKNMEELIEAISRD